MGCHFRAHMDAISPGPANRPKAGPVSLALKWPPVTFGARTGLPPRRRLYRACPAPGTLRLHAPQQAVQIGQRRPQLVGQGLELVGRAVARVHGRQATARRWNVNAKVRKGQESVREIARQGAAPNTSDLTAMRHLE